MLKLGFHTPILKSKLCNLINRINFNYPYGENTHFLIHLYIYSEIIFRMHGHDWSEKYVVCPFCRNGWSILKYTKTNHLMFRCDDCKLLIFANSPDSEDEVIRFCNIPKLESLDYTYDDVEIW
jgi:hypothetical protein